MTEPDSQGDTRRSRLPPAAGLVVAAAVAVVAFSPNVDMECNGWHILTEKPYVCFHQGERGWNIYIAAPRESPPPSPEKAKGADVTSG